MVFDVGMKPICIAQKHKKHLVYRGNLFLSGLKPLSSCLEGAFKKLIEPLRPLQMQSMARVFPYYQLRFWHVRRKVSRVGRVDEIVRIARDNQHLWD